MKIEYDEKNKKMYCPKCGNKMEYYDDVDDWRYTELWLCENPKCIISRIAIG